MKDPDDHALRLDAIENSIVIISEWLLKDSPEFASFAKHNLRGFAHAAVKTFPDEEERAAHMIHQMAVLLKLVDP